jgi:hypothetical protein
MNMNRITRLLASVVVVASAAASWSRADEQVAVPKPEKIVTREQWGSNPAPIPDSRKHTPKWITIHHAGTLWTNDKDPAEFVRNMQAWGKKRPQIEKPPRNTFWPDLPYHFLIAHDGRIFEGRPLEYEPDTNTRYSVAGNIGVEMMGNFNLQRPSPEQLDSVVRLTAWLMQQTKIDLDHVRTHRDAAAGQTDCPGRDFYRYFLDGKFKQWVSAVLAGQDPKIDPGPPLPPEPAGPTELITDTKPKPKTPATSN